MKRKRIIIVAVILTLALLGWKTCGGKKSAGDAARKIEHHEHGKNEHVEKGRVELSDEQVKNSGIVLEAAGPAKLQAKLRLFGKISPNEERLAHVMPRYPGVVKRVGKRLGEAVQKDDVLAVIQSNESLQEYEIKSDINGTVVEKDIVLGEAVGSDKTIYVVVDLSTVWVDLNVYRQDFPKLQLGQKVILEATGVSGKIEGAITYISPLGSESTQTMLARSEVPNNKGLLRPGLFVVGNVVLGEEKVPVAVKESALQTVEEKEVVFVRESSSFQARPASFGKRDGEWVEVVSGIKPGEKYAAQNSFIIKAEMGKGEAGHED
jgi:cobalt-zinc-cadmium efflux system membrane fusion protein